MKIVAPGHPVDTFKKENRELEKVVARNFVKCSATRKMLLPQIGGEILSQPVESAL